METANGESGRTRLISGVSPAFLTPVKANCWKASAAPLQVVVGSLDDLNSVCLFLPGGRRLLFLAFSSQVRRLRKQPLEEKASV